MIGGKWLGERIVRVEEGRGIKYPKDHRHVWYHRIISIDFAGKQRPRITIIIDVGEISARNYVAEYPTHFAKRKIPPRKFNTPSSPSGPGRNSNQRSRGQEGIGTGWGGGRQRGIGGHDKKGDYDFWTIKQKGKEEEQGERRDCDDKLRLKFQVLSCVGGHLHRWLASGVTGVGAGWRKVRFIRQDRG